MKRLLVAMVMASVWLSVSIGSPALAQSDSVSATASVKRQLHPLLTEMLLAANAHDTDRYMTAFLRGPGLVFSFNGTIIQGWPELEAQQRKWWNNGKSDVVYSERRPSIITVLSRDAAVLTMELESRRTASNGQLAVGTAVVTMVYQKRPEGWRVVQAHESTVR